MRELPIKGTNRSVAVVGAGIAGLTAARELAKQGFDVQIFDKGRAPGGRVATRRYDEANGQYSFDHGAQYFTVRDSAFAAAVEPVIAEGLVKPWQGRFGAWDGTLMIAKLHDEMRFVGVPGMSALAKALASGLNTHCKETVSRISEHGERGWALTLASGSRAEYFDELVLAIPDAQVRDLLLASDLQGLIPHIPAPALAPCWAVLAAFADPVATPFDAIFVNDGMLGFAARDSSKPGRPSGCDSWVLHLGAAASAARIEHEKTAVAQEAIRAFSSVLRLDQLPQLAFLDAHRWRYATLTKPCDEDFVRVADRKFGVCGDWLSAGRIEGAYLSGLRLARSILSH